MATIDNVKAEKINIIHYSGDDYDEVWEINKDDGTPYNLSGKVVKLTIKKDKSFNSYVEQLTTADGTISLSGGNNNVLTFSKVITLNQFIYFYDLAVIDDNYTISYGTWEEIKDIT